MNKTKTIGEAIEIVNKKLEENWNKPEYKHWMSKDEKVSSQKTIDRYSLHHIIIEAFTILEKEEEKDDSEESRMEYTAYPKIEGNDISMSKLDIYFVAKRKKSKFEGKLTYVSIDYAEGWEAYKDTPIFDRIEQTRKKRAESDDYREKEVSKQKNEFLAKINQLGITISDFEDLQKQYKYFDYTEIQNIKKESIK